MSDGLISNLCFFSVSLCRVLQGAHRIVREVHEPDVYQDLRPPLHTEFTRLPGAVRGAAQILFWLVSVTSPQSHLRWSRGLCKVSLVGLNLQQ